MSLGHAQASDRGREFAAKWAECVFAAGGQPKSTLELRDDLAGRMETYGRDPSELKIISACGPIVARTESEARDKADEISERIPTEAAIANMSGHWNVDLTKFAPETRVSELGDVDGTRGMVEMYRADGDPTLAEVAKKYLNMAGQDAFVGTPTKVADTLEWLFHDGQIDGFQLSPQWYAPDYYRDIVDLLIPELQARGLVRSSYVGGATLRELLMQNTQT